MNRKLNLVWCDVLVDAKEACVAPVMPSGLGEQSSRKPWSREVQHAELQMLNSGE